MGFFELLGVGVVLYYVVHLILWIVLDSDIQLFVKEKLGRPICMHAQNGVRLALSARRVETLQRVRTECLARGGGALSADDVLVLPMDMLETDRHAAHMQRVLGHFGGQLDVLVCNAGRSQRAKWSDVDLAVDRELFDLDVFAVVNLTRTYLKHLLAKVAAGGQLRGHVAVTSSSAGLIGVPNSCSYVGAKFAVHGYFESLKVEHPELDVTVFCPGPTTTEFLEQAFTAERGQKFEGAAAEASSRRMSAERCAALMATALANKLYVNFVGNFPVPLLLNLVLYYPNLKYLVMVALGAGGLKRIRDPESVKKA